MNRRTLCTYEGLNLIMPISPPAANIQDHNGQYRRRQELGGSGKGPRATAQGRGPAAVRL